MMSECTEHTFSPGYLVFEGFPRCASGKEPVCQCRRQEMWVRSLGWKIPWKRAWQPTPIFLPVESYQRSLADYGPEGCEIGYD